MSRKRFVKLFMSRGMQRNAAQIEARIVSKFGIPYKFFYSHFWKDAGIPKKFYFARGRSNGRHSFPFYAGVDLANGPDQTAVCPVSTASIIAMTADSVPEIKKPDSGKIYWFITDIWETLAPVPVTVTQDNDGLLTVKWQVTEDYAEEYEEIDRSQLYASEAEAWRAINEGR